MGLRYYGMLVYVVGGVFLAGVGYAAAEAKLIIPVVEETWIGRIEKKSDTEIEFVSGGERYEIAGLLEKYLVKNDGKEMQITGRLIEGHVIEVSKVQQPPVLK
jgi:hypothetical protein